MCINIFALSIIHRIFIGDGVTEKKKFLILTMFGNRYGIFNKLESFINEKS